MLELTPRSPLAHRRSAAGPSVCISFPSLVIEESPAKGLIAIAHGPGCEDARTAASDVLGCTLPTRPNTLCRAEHDVAWLGPRRWLVMTEKRGDSALQEKLHRAISSRSGSAALVSDALSGFSIEGRAARDLLATGTSLELSEHAFPVNTCAQTALAKVSSLIVRHSADSFNVYVDRALARYLWLWFETASREFDKGA